MGIKKIFPKSVSKSDLIFSSAGEERSWVTGTPTTQSKAFAELLAPQNCPLWALYPTSVPFITDVECALASRASASKSVSVSPAPHWGAQELLSLWAPPPTCIAPGNVNHRPSRCSQNTVSFAFYFGSNIKLLGRFGKSCVELRQAWVILGWGRGRCMQGTWLPSSLYKAILNKCSCFWKWCPACCGQEKGRCPYLVGDLFGLY